ncbi:AMP-binding domain-containing protein [Aphelenchoides besseyi]|nr:AMP-binding domain-containing protein [Aphelenchoides besseyi]KAI6201053.1 AMP-binding domain-containing protein [Aphelenchoides besseyi]
MPDSKSEGGGNRRLEEELIEQSRPIHIIALHIFLQAFFAVYDAIVFIPFKIFADPEKKRERSDRVKARPSVEGDPASGWRHVDTIGRDLIANVYPNCATLGDIWDRNVREFSTLPCMGTRQLLEGEEVQKDGKTFLELTFGDYLFDTFEDVNERVNCVINGLKTYDMKKGDHVVIFAETRADWMQTALACFKSGYPVITVYATLGEDGVAYALKECDAKAIFTTRNLLPKIAKVLESSSSTHTVIYYQELHRRTDDDGYATAEHNETFRKLNKRLESFDTLLNVGAASRVMVNAPGPDDLAMIMYTSGTTGNPKGVMLSHRNIIAAISGQGTILSVSQDDTFIGYLPLAHILEVCAELVIFSKGACIGYSSAQTLFDRAPKIKKGTKGDCAVLKPTLIACVPAVMDRIFKAVTDEVKSKSPLFREIFRICYERKRTRYEEGYVSLVMNKLAFNRIGKLLGGNLRYVLSGGAALNPETQRFMNICFCCPVVQGYGLTETCGGATLADEFDLSTGSVGPPLRCCEIRLREWAEANYSPNNEVPQGEILINGDNVALGYYKNEEKTKEDFIKLDGKRYFATGDIGEFRSDGSLRIIDRKKDLIKLAHGEYVSLAKAETTLLTNPNVDNICVYGDQHRDYLIALVVPNQKNVEKMAHDNGITGSWEEMCKNKKLAQILCKELTSFVAGKLNKQEIPQKCVLCHEPWTPASGLLTEALKLKRKQIEKAFEAEIKSLYNSK